MGWLVLVLLALPIAELWLLLVIGGRIGFWPTVGMAVGTAVLGGYLARHEGRRALGAWRSALAEGRMPDEGILGGVLILVGGVLLAAPGVITDLIGLALLFPPTRRRIAARVRAHLARRLERGAAPGGGSFAFDVRVVDLGGAAWPDGDPAGRREVIDAEAEVVTDAEPKRLPPSAGRPLS